MDVWGDAGQISSAIGGLATVAVAAFGWKLWQATGELRDRTKTLGDKTGELADATFQLVEQTSEANALVKQAAQAELHALRRPKLEIGVFWNFEESYANGKLLVRHATDSESESIDTLAAEIVPADDAAMQNAARQLDRPWRFEHGGPRGAPRRELGRGITSGWTLTLNEAGRPTQAWGRVASDGPLLVLLTASIGDNQWQYSVLIDPGAANGMVRVS